jgi:hypothetical protein
MDDQEIAAVMRDIVFQRRRTHVNAAWLAAEALTMLGFDGSPHEPRWIAAHRKFTGITAGNRFVVIHAH